MSNPSKDLLFKLACRPCMNALVRNTHIETL